MDMREDENQDLDDDDLAELEATYEMEAGGVDASANVVADVAERALEPLASARPDGSTIEEVAASLVGGVPGVEALAEEPGETDMDRNNSLPDQAGPLADEVAAGLVQAPLEPWQRMTPPSAAGYIYFEGRSVMRIQRNKLVGRLTLTCYRHPQCNMLINLDRAPPDEVLKQWLFEVGAPEEGASKEDRKALAKEHMRIGKARWTARM